MMMWLSFNVDANSLSNIQLRLNKGNTQHAKIYFKNVSRDVKDEKFEYLSQTSTKDDLI